jgi:hypothetical protein
MLAKPTEQGFHPAPPFHIRVFPGSGHCLDELPFEVEEIPRCTIRVREQELDTDERRQHEIRRPLADPLGGSSLPANVSRIRSDGLQVDPRRDQLVSGELPAAPRLSPRVIGEYRELLVHRNESAPRPGGGSVGMF